MHPDHETEYRYFETTKQEYQKQRDMHIKTTKQEL